MFKRTAVFYEWFRGKTITHPTFKDDLEESGRSGFCL
jgi:hypothetical protein